MCIGRAACDPALPDVRLALDAQAALVSGLAVAAVLEPLFVLGHLRGADSDGRAGIQASAVAAMTSMELQNEGTDHTVIYYVDPDESRGEFTLDRLIPTPSVGQTFSIEYEGDDEDLEGTSLDYTVAEVTWTLFASGAVQLWVRLTR